MIKMGTTAQAPQRIAVIGAGVAGLTAAWLLQRKHDVTIFEKNDYVGGHTRTLRVPNGPDKGTPVDTGFIVMNHRNYPLFTKVLEQLKVRLCDSSMTFSYYDHAHRYGYSGNSLTSLFPRFRDYVSPRHLRLIRDLWPWENIFKTAPSVTSFSTITCIQWVPQSGLPRLLKCIVSPLSRTYTFLKTTACFD